MEREGGRRGEGSRERMRDSYLFACRYDDPPILAGQGTAALEVVEQMDKLGQHLDAVVIPVGGGGLLAGMAITLKHLLPHVRVIVRRL